MMKLFRFKGKISLEQRLFFSFLILLASAALAFHGTHMGVDLEKVTLTTKDGVKISGVLVSPAGHSQERLPAVVFCHGLLASKDPYLYGIRRLARSGMRVLAIDFRGHGRSSGFSDFGFSESEDVLLGVSYLAHRLDVDVNNIALVGHSLGGITVTRAGCKVRGKNVRAVVAIYCWPGFQHAVEGVFGPLEDGFIGRLWLSFAWSHSFPLNEDELRSRDVLPLLGPDKQPPNYLLIHATGESLVSMKDAMGILARAAGLDEIEPGKAYGDQRKLTARKFLLIKGNHGSEAISPAAYEAIEGWLTLCLDKVITYQGFDAGMFLAFVGTIISLAAVLYIYSLLRSWLSGKMDKPEINIRERPAWSAWLAGLGLVLVSAPCLWLVSHAGSLHIVRTWIGDVLCTYVLVRSLLILVVLVILSPFLRKKIYAFYGALIPGAPTFLDWSLGLAPTLWLVISLSLLGLIVWIPPALPKDTLGFIVLFFILFIHYLLEEGFFRGIISRSLGRSSTRKEASVTGLIGGLGYAASFIFLFPSWGYSIDLQVFRLPMLPFVLIMFPVVYYFHSTLTTYLYRATGNILVSAASMAFLLAWVFTTFGVRAA